MNEPRTIRVTGKGRIRVRPDTTVITMETDGVYPEYSETLRKSSEDTEHLKDLLAAFGFDRSDLKTLSFNVDTRYESYKDRNIFRQRFIGYQYRHVMKVAFGSDQDRLGRLLWALAHCPVNPQFSLKYSVSDPEAARRELLQKAVTDAREKAAVLTQAAGVSLKSIINIDYSWGQIDFEVRPMSRMLIEENCIAPPSAAESRKYDMAIEPDDIEADDTVTVLWEIG